MREWLEYAAAWVGVKFLGLLPRPMARFVGAAFVRTAFLLRPQLGRTAMLNLTLAFPDWDDAHRRQVIRGMVRQVGWMVGEFSSSRDTPAKISSVS